MTTYKQLADRINSWAGLDHEFTEHEIKALVWALAKDDELRRDFNRLELREWREQMGELRSIHEENEAPVPPSGSSEAAVASADALIVSLTDKAMDKNAPLYRRLAGGTDKENG